MKQASALRSTITVAAMVASLASPRIHAAEFHVAPAGSDSNPGTTERPFQTIERARDAVRGIKAREATSVIIHGGTYVLGRTLELTPQDSGAKEKPVRYIAAQGETPVITSARVIAGWKRVEETHPGLPAAGRGKVWVADVPKGWRFHNLYVNDQPQQVARTPNGDVKDWRAWPRIQGNASIAPGGLKVTVPAGLLKHLPDNGDVEVNFIPVEWWNSLPVLRKIDGDTAILGSRNPSTWVFGGRYYQEGALQFRNALVCLDQPGEWCVDSAAGKVYFWPPDGTMAGRTVTAPTLHELIRLQGDDLAARSNDWRVKYDAAGNRVEKTAPPLVTIGASAFDQHVSHVELRGLTFECTDRMPEDEWPRDWLKRNCENPDGTLFFQGAEACVVADCTFRNCGAYAVVLDHYAQRISMLGNEMSGLGSGGVQVSGYGPGTLDVNHHNAIRRNYIHGTGRDYMHSAAVTIFGSGHNDVSLNWIADCPYAAVSIVGAPHSLIDHPDDPVQGPSIDLSGDRTAQFQTRRHELPPPGGRWRDSPDFEESKPFQHSGGNWIARNIVDEFMTTLGDGGAFYAWMADHDNVWLENLAKRVNHHSRGWVIYMDGWNGRTLLQDNLSWADSANHLDTAKIPDPAARPGQAMTKGANAPIQFVGKTLCRWNNNINSYPAKPAGFDERCLVIQNDAGAEGGPVAPVFPSLRGWPKTVTQDMMDALMGKPRHERVTLAACTVVKAAEARQLNGPRFDDQHVNIGWCDDGGTIIFGPYRFVLGTIHAMEAMVGVDPGFAGSKMHVRLDTTNGPTVGTFVFRSTGGFARIAPQAIPVKDLSGDHLLYFVFEGGRGICNLNGFRFLPAEATQ